MAHGKKNTRHPLTDEDGKEMTMTMNTTSGAADKRSDAPLADAPDWPIRLGKDFIDRATAEITPHWGPLGWVTYRRTYSRFIDSLGRAEDWAETVRRTIEGNINLDPRLKKNETGLIDPTVIAEDTAEAQDLFRLIYGLAATPSGRNLWVSGTPYQRRHGDSLNNCWFIAIRPQAYGDSEIVPSYVRPDQKVVSMPYAFMFDELMKGGGVGFSVTGENVSQLPEVSRAVPVTVIMGSSNGSYDECVKAGAVDRDEWVAQHGDPAADQNVWFYDVDDSREGWVYALAAVIDAHFGYFDQKKTSVVLDMTRIRERGAKIHGFGGTASGAGPLIEMLGDVDTVLNEAAGRSLTAVDATDISNLIGKAVVAGNVRRSAELALGDWDDDGFRTMKQDQDKLMHHRWASNNSVVVDGRPEQYEAVARDVVVHGEPGIVDLDLSRSYGRLIDGPTNADPRAEGTNPCGEITLENGEPCNLFEVFPAIAQEQGWDMKKVFALAVRFAKRVTFGHYDWEVSRTAIERNRRIGISMSGIQDWILSTLGHRVVTGYRQERQDDGTTRRVPVYDPKAVGLVEGFYQDVLDADREYSHELGCAMSIKHTTVKPSGTVAKLAGASEGMHFHYAGYLIQRIRFQDTDPLLPALLACGYRIEPDVYTKHTMCVEFPVKAPNADSPQFASAGTVSAEEQLANQSFLQTYWSDNAVSCTVTFQKEEAKDLPRILSNYAGKIKSTSMLQYYGSGLTQAPKEPISKEEYEKRAAKIVDDPRDAFRRLNMAGARSEKDLTLVDQSDCESGACPVR